MNIQHHNTKYRFGRIFKPPKIAMTKMDSTTFGSNGTYIGLDDNIDRWRYLRMQWYDRHKIYIYIHWRIPFFLFGGRHWKSSSRMANGQKHDHIINSNAHGRIDNRNVISEHWIGQAYQETILHNRYNKLIQNALTSSYHRNAHRFIVDKVTYNVSRRHHPLLTVVCLHFIISPVFFFLSLVCLCILVKQIYTIFFSVHVFSLCFCVRAIQRLSGSEPCVPFIRCSANAMLMFNRDNSNVMRMQAFLSQWQLHSNKRLCDLVFFSRLFAALHSPYTRQKDTKSSRKC